MEAEITLKYDKAKIAEAVANAVSPDNLKTPAGLSVKTTRKRNKVVTYIGCKRKLPTFIATIDDLLFCITIAEKIIRTAEKMG